MYLFVKSAGQLISTLLRNEKIGQPGVTSIFFYEELEKKLVLNHHWHTIGICTDINFYVNNEINVRL